MGLSFNAENLGLMKRVETQLVHLLMPMRQTVEAALIVFALARCMRTLIRLYPKPRQVELRRVVIDYLEGRVSPRDDPDAGLLVN